MTPDIALIKLARPVQMFNSTVRPICLASPGVLERPLCPDMSKDRGQYWVRLTLPAYVGTGAVLVSCLIIFFFFFLGFKLMLPATNILVEMLQPAS